MDILFLTETWRASDVSPAFKAATPTIQNYSMLQDLEPGYVTMVVDVVQSLVDIYPL